MRTAEITAPDRVEVLDRPLPKRPVGSSDLRVRMLAVGICGTDQSLATGLRTPPELPWRLGHEGIGEVAEVGSDTHGFAVGDRVALEPNITCGRCEYCSLGMTSACTSRLSAGVLTQPGFLAEVVDHPSEFCHRLPQEMALERAVCVEPLAVAASAIRRTGLDGTENVLVLGAGAQGLLSIVTLVAQGYRPYVSEPDGGRRALAVDLGARVFTPRQCPAPDVVIDAAGVPEALGAVVDHLAPFAAITLVGEDHHHLGASSFSIVQKQLRIKGSFIYEHPRDMAEAVELLDEMPTEKIMGPALALDDVPAVFAGKGSHRGENSQPGASPLLEVTSRPEVKQWVDMRLRTHNAHAMH
ncbi:zinc-dependent alcohol dehydrogenase [Brevibacterium sp. UCMA 11752]|uniref:zinc-dependent alcohol dehydrogenase n=1 Tax=Brevibacterium sp. UCMA 11752 TaxID=2745946 RepID=UPI001F4696D5|nr:alcohol dehydrogenase catalytic domain-containing protein [Brevibacterium sp. UCMA 11752]MCF2587049.1 alcohol dehydrogenase catalytic domain-containing protein [Brevibacterium sp. UCMA 11752]